jgi:hypothetical protein
MVERATSPNRRLTATTLHQRSPEPREPRSPRPQVIALCVKIAGRKSQAACISRRLLGPPPRERAVTPNDLQFIAGEADGESIIGAFTIWKKRTFYVLRQGLVCLVD